MHSYRITWWIVFLHFTLLKKITITYTDRSLNHIVKNTATFIRMIFNYLKIRQNFIPRTTDFLIRHNFIDCISRDSFNKCIDLYHNNRGAICILFVNTNTITCSNVVPWRDIFLDNINQINKVLILVQGWLFKDYIFLA